MVQRAGSFNLNQKGMMKAAKKTAQQGDVLLRKLERIPDGERKPLPRTHRGFVLAEGEATGHAHVVDDDEAQLIQIGERMLLSLSKAATITHEEHKPVRLSPGIWEIGRVQEFDYLSQMARTVVD